MHLSHRTLLVRALLLPALVAFLSFGLISCDTADPDPGGADVSVVSYNLYLGTDIFDLVGTQPQELPLVVHRLFQEVHATDYPTRARRIAQLIAEHDPHLVGLQEVTLYRSQTPSAIMQGQPPNAQHVEYDFLQILLGELTGLGLNYTEVSTVTNADVQVPATADGQSFYDLRLTDRDVILARNDVSVTGATDYRFSLDATAMIPVGGQNVPFFRGFNYVVATVDGVQFTFANAHLEVGSQAQVQQAQAQEMLQQLQGRPEPIILVGDLNSRADGTSTQTYAMVTGQGYTDVFTQMGTAEHTCCQAADLRNPQSALNQRIDFILYRGNATPLFSETLGNEPADRIARPGTGELLWPSDHAGLAATLRVHN